MSISNKTIVEMVAMLLRGITCKVPVNPNMAAEMFEKRLLDIDVDFAHSDGVGYVTYNGDDIMFVQWMEDGVEFDEHHEHPKTLDVCRVALEVLTDIEMMDEEDSSDDMEWV